MRDISKKEATILGLLATGYIEDKGRSQKYRCFREDKPSGVPYRTFLVGKSGALRLIRAQHSAISDSVSRTGTKQHAAFAYTGRIYRVVKDGLLTVQYQRMYAASLSGEIPTTKEGFYDDSET